MYQNQDPGHVQTDTDTPVTLFEVLSGWKNGIIEVSLGSLSSLLSWRRKSPSATEEEAAEAAEAVEPVEVEGFSWYAGVFLGTILDFACVFLRKIYGHF